MHSNFRFELEATGIRQLSILIFICRYSRPISICLKSSLKSCQQNNIPKVFNPTKLFFSHFVHYVINVKAEKLERFYVEVMFHVCFHLARVHLYLSSKKSFVSGFEGKISWASIISKKSCSKEILKKRHNKKVKLIRYGYPREVQRGDFNLRKSLSMPSLTL